MSERKLAHIERIAEIIPIEGADRIVSYRVLNWNVISKKDEFAVGDLVVFIEPDAWVPNTLAPFLTKPGKFPKVYGGIQGERLKTVKLKGVISQGLLLPIDTASNKFIGSKFDEGQEIFEFLFTGQDVTELLGIIKWEPEPEKIPVNAMGNFPHFIPKTDQERCISAGTMIETTLGSFPIEQIVEQQMEVHVKSFDHETGNVVWSKVIDHSRMRNNSEKWVKFTLDDGTIIVVTKNHLMWSDDINAYREAGKMEVGDYFIKKTD